MSESFYDELDALTSRHREQEATKAREEENEARFKRLEDGIGAIGAKLDEHFSSPAAAGNSEPSAADKEEEKPSGRQADPPPTNSEPETMNVERVGRYSVPRIYAGEDEPDIVTYIDAETGETMTRKGRRKNYPTQTSVEIVMPEPENRPQEPDEATG